MVEIRSADPTSVEAALHSLDTSFLANVVFDMLAPPRSGRASTRADQCTAMRTRSRALMV